MNNYKLISVMVDVTVTIIPTPEYYGLHLYDLSRLFIDIPRKSMISEYFFKDIINDHIHNIILNKYNYDIDASNIKISRLEDFMNGNPNVNITIEDEDLSKMIVEDQSNYIPDSIVAKILLPNGNPANNPFLIDILTRKPNQVPLSITIVENKILGSNPEYFINKMIFDWSRHRSKYHIFERIIRHNRPIIIKKILINLCNNTTNKEFASNCVKFVLNEASQGHVNINSKIIDKMINYAELYDNSFILDAIISFTQHTT